MSSPQSRLEHLAGGTVGHVVDIYLPRTQTFIYTQLRFASRYRPVVLAGRTENLSEFPFSPIVDLDAPEQFAMRSRLGALARGFRSPKTLRLADAIGRLGCDVLHAHFGWTASGMRAAASKKHLPFVTTFYGADLAFPQNGAAWADAYARLFAEGTLFVCEGPRMAESLAGLGCPESKIRLVRIAIDLEQFPYAARPASRPLIVLAAGRFIEKKGFDTAIRAFAAARDRLGESELWLVGDGELRAELEHLADDLHVSSSVRFLGMLSHVEYRDAVSRAHIGLQPSRTARNGDTEGGAPTVLLEMQASGIPVVASRHADIPYVVEAVDALADEHDVAGLADALAAVADLSPADAEARARRARAFVEREHGAESVAGRLAEVYDEATGSSATARPPAA